eukprot:CAMPEP_0184326194 /NCGR_PEP_ID=MMETSP1049-20130417/142433_1 /TAXON_ID=77928 /ORGANISM="Proteomonas sulcata, Strain CCMP704" /LENGTH=121 /DNA_ID=CAMNT_0026648371 /DNA_START=268 /DNA_END=634 /DNA_ORIENTATION=+
MKESEDVVREGATWVDVAVNKMNVLTLGGAALVVQDDSVRLLPDWVDVAVNKMNVLTLGGAALVVQDDSVRLLPEVFGGSSLFDSPPASASDPAPLFSWLITADRGLPCAVAIMLLTGSTE